PPVRSAAPFGSKVAVWLNLAAFSGLVGNQVPVDASYNSALEMDVLPLVVPPATRTCPLGSNVAVWDQRGVVSESAAVQAPVAGSVHLGTQPGPVRAAVAAGDEDSAIWQHGCGVMVPVAIHRAGDGPSSGGRIVQLGCGRSEAAAGFAADHEQFAIQQQGGCM